jgi:hypothetical protein
MTLTPEQTKLFSTKPPTPSGDQTLEQAREAATFHFRHACAFEGLGIPSEEDVRAELDRRFPPSSPKPSLKRPERT